MEISGALFPAAENYGYGMIQNLNINGLLSYIPVNSTSTSDEGDYQTQKHGIIVDERKRRRMISNRESARRSRMRKQKHLDELWSLVVRLRTENQSLMEKLNQLTESQEQLLQENAKLKGEASDFFRMLTGLQMGSPYTTHMRELEEVPCNTFDLIAESSTQSNE
ncbi:basic leucine zipper 8-like [Momordica charantia]|uniref:Basic leucine zipper 8-like n=1 Tax=Momordica charantia TaxID=3673 RepID=A0A6J1CX59_MOMCH|nr:basic leucine zipper 8-like [Momordica charantia]